jgi:hypothetical protein
MTGPLEIVGPMTQIICILIIIGLVIYFHWPERWTRRP